MSVTNEENKVSYVANGGANYIIPFYFENDTHLKLYINDVLSTFTATGEGELTGGILTITSTLPVAPSSVVIVREVPLKQENTFNEGGPFLADTVEKMFDKLTFIAQQINEQASRSIKLPISSAIDTQLTGEVIPRGMLVLNSEADAFELGPNVDTFYATVVSSSTSAAASAASAATSATNSNTSSIASASSAASALGSANAASASALSATNSATSATNSATNATNSATSAAGSATTATTQAAAASVSATNANGSATTATTQATAATTSANNSATSASAAAVSASAALTSENNASTSASAAATSAASFSGHVADTLVHGVTGAVVGTTNTQTLTNKTLTSPSIVTPTRLDAKQGTEAALTTYAATASNGQLCFATDTKVMYQVLDSALVPLGAGGGGTSLNFNNSGNNSPVIEYIDGIKIAAFDNVSNQELYALLTVPSSYRAGKQIKLKSGQFFNTSTTGNVSIKTATALITGTSVLGTYPNIRTSSNAQVAVPGVANTVKDIGEIDLTDSAGLINGVSVLAGHKLRIRLYRNNAGETSGADNDARLVLDSFEPTFS